MGKRPEAPVRGQASHRNSSGRKKSSRPPRKKSGESEGAGLISRFAPDHMSANPTSDDAGRFHTHGRF